MTSVLAFAVGTVFLANAHAHNDYEHGRPLLDALDQDFGSVEADVYLVNGDLLVGHDKKGLKPERTLKALYLQTLARRIRENNGSVYGDGHTLTLLVDIKEDGAAVFKELEREVSSMKEFSVLDGVRPVEFVISGDRPIELIANEDGQWAGIDGRLGDLDTQLGPKTMPWISDNWTTNFKWNGEDTISEDERATLKSITAKAHRAGRRVRFWATPETPQFWTEALADGVDIIGTDNLKRLHDFLVLKR